MNGTDLPEWKRDDFELVAATGENTHAKGKIAELHDQLVDTIPLMTDDDLTAFIALVECELGKTGTL